MQVKICGVTQSEDAYQAAKAGADYIGVIFSPISKRMVTLEQAYEIKSAIQDTNSQLVGVFVNESAEQIHTICQQADISIIQLHGDQSRNAINFFIKTYSIFYAIPTNNNIFQEEYYYHSNIIPLYDNDKSKNSKPFQWKYFVPPKKPWILAGGLNINNVAEAIALLNPTIVDVASGVEQRNSIRKDHYLLQAFIETAKIRKNL